ncbi:MAG: protein kinase, partial [Methylococcaceae bacterium]|nr:protein kinase [Methylococcaceae bacterium]
MRLSAGTKLGPDKIVAPLGAGGMGEVYRALDTRLDREVAVKILPEATTGDARARARFEREAKTVAALSHPNILSIHDIHLDGDVPYAVMELLEGETLAQRIARGTLHWKEAVSLGSAMAEGLAAAHAKGVVHRDLKPSNIFLTVDGRLKILDFGLARTSRSEAGTAETEADTVTATEPGTVLGTVGYMSPEQIRGLPAEATSDIFSFCCVLYEMVAGKRPFGGATAPEAMAAILRDTAQPLAEGPRAIPEELERLVAHCLEKHPEQRFQSARDLLYALRSLQTGPSAAVTVPGVGGLKNRTGRVFLFAAAAVAVAAGALFSFVPSARPWPRTPSIHSVAVLPLANLSGDPDQEYFADGMTDELITGLSKIPSIRVISRTSVMRFKGTKEPLSAIARMLGVDLVIEGSVRRSGEQVRIDAKLLEAAGERSLWASSFNRTLKDVFVLQSEVATAISREIGGRLSKTEEARLAPKKPVPPEAYEAYLKGKFYQNRLGPEDLEKARDYFEKSIKLAPDFAPAYAGLASYYITLAAEGAVSPKLA